MANQNIQEKVKNIRYFTSSDMNEDMYNRLARLREVVMSREENSPHLLNRKNVTGIWYLTDLSFEEGEPQIIVRVDENNPDLKIGSYTRLLLHGEIFDILHNDVNYDYEKEINHGDTMIQGLQSKLFNEIEQERVLAVYDKERERHGYSKRT